MFFVWDEDKAIANWKKHRVTFEAAVEVFFDEYAIDRLDKEHSTTESRHNIIGAARDLAKGSETLFVVYVERVDDYEDHEVIRIISARPANRKERKIYEQGLCR